VIRGYTIRICDDCINLKGQMCSTPECVFCWKSMTEVGEVLHALLIRPVIDGERFDTEYAFSLATKEATQG
jgi:hypothetical protein